MLNGGYLWFTGEVKNQFIVYIGAVSAAIFSTAILLSLHFKRRCPLVISLSKPTEKQNVTEYLISILTSARPNSHCGLSTSVSVKIQGVYNDTGFILLKNQKARREIFRRGANDIFHITTDKSLGDLVSVSIRLLNKLDDICCKWAPVKIELMRFDTREKWNTTEMPNLTCTKEVTETIPVAKPMLQKLRFRNYARNVLKFHTWISLLMFPECYGAFTITDRVLLLIFTETCFLFGCMVTFFLFHQNCTDFQLMVADLIALFVTLFTMGGVIISLEVILRNVRPTYRKKYSGLPKRPIVTNKKDQLNSMDEYLSGLKNEDGSSGVDRDRKQARPEQQLGSKGRVIKNHKPGKSSKHPVQKRYRETKRRGKQINNFKTAIIDKAEFRTPGENRTSKEIKGRSMGHSINKQMNNCNCNVTERQSCVLNIYSYESKTSTDEWSSEENCKSMVNPPTCIKSDCFEESAVDEYKTYIRAYINGGHSWETGSGDSLTELPHVINMDVIEADISPLANTCQSDKKLSSCSDIKRIRHNDIDSNFLLPGKDYGTEEPSRLPVSSESLMLPTSNLDKTYLLLNYNCSSKPRCCTPNSMHVSNEDDMLNVRQNVKNSEKSTDSIVNRSRKESYGEIKSNNSRTDKQSNHENDSLLPSDFLSLSPQKQRSVPRASQEKSQYVKIGAISSQPSVNTGMRQNISKIARKSETKAYFQPIKSLNSKKKSKHIDKGFVKDTSMQSVGVVSDWTHSSGSAQLTLVNNDIFSAKPVLNNKTTEFSPVPVEKKYSALVDIYVTVNLDNGRDEFNKDSPVFMFDSLIPSAKNRSSSVISKPQSEAFTKKSEKEYVKIDLFCGKEKKYAFPSDASIDRVPCRPLHNDVMNKSTGTLSKKKICRIPHEEMLRRTSFVSSVSDASFLKEPCCPSRSLIKDKSSETLVEKAVTTTSDGETLQDISLSYETLSTLSMPSPASLLLVDDPYIDRAMHLIDTTSSDDSVCYIPEYEINCDNKWILNTKPMETDLFIRRFIKMLSIDLNAAFRDTEKSIIETVIKWGEMLCSRLWYRVELWIDEPSLIQKHSIVHFPADLSDNPQDQERASCSLLENWKRKIPLIRQRAVIQEWDEADWLDGTFGKPFLFDSKYSIICRCKGSRCKTLRPVYKALLHISTYILSKLVKTLQTKNGSVVLDMRSYFKAYQILTKEFEDRSLELAEAIVNHENPEDILERSKIYSDCGLGLLSSLLVLRSINKSSVVFDYEYRLYATAHQLAFEVIYESEECVLMEVIEDMHVRQLYKISEKKAIEEVMKELANPIFVFTYHLLRKRTLGSFMEFLEDCPNRKVVEEAIKLRALAWKNEGFVVETDKTVPLVQALVRKSVRTKDNNLKVISNISKLRDLEHKVHDLVDGSSTSVINWIVCLVDEKVRKKKAPKPDFLSEVISLYLDISCVELHKYLFESSMGFIDHFKETSLEDVKHRRKELLPHHIKGITEPLPHNIKGITAKPLLPHKSYLKGHKEDFLKSKSKEIVHDVILKSQISLTEEVDPCCLELKDLRELKRDIKPLMMYSKFLEMRIKKTGKEEIQNELKKYEKKHKRYLAVNLQNVTDSYYVADIVPSYQRKDLFFLEWLVTGQLRKQLSPGVKRTCIMFMVLFIVCGLGYVTVKGGELTSAQCQEWLCLYFFCTFIFAFIISPIKSILFTYCLEKQKTERQLEMFFDYL